MSAIFELRATDQTGVRPNASPQGIFDAVAILYTDLDMEMLESVKDYFSERYFLDGNQTYADELLRVHQGYQAHVRQVQIGEDA